MGKILVIILATCMALGLLVHFLGANSMGSTAFHFPGTDHTSGFAVTWFVVGGLVIGGLFYKLVKGK